MSVNSCDALVCSRLQQLAGNELLNCENNSVLAPDADGSVAVLDCLHGVLDLKVASIWGEDGVLEIVTRTYRRLELQLARCFWRVNLATRVVQAYHDGR